MVLKKEDLKEGWIVVDEKRPVKDMNVLCAHDYCDIAVAEIGHYVGYDDYSDGRVYRFKNDYDEYISCVKWKHIERERI